MLTIFWCRQERPIFSLNQVISTVVLQFFVKLQRYAHLERATHRLHQSRNQQSCRCVCVCGGGKSRILFATVTSCQAGFQTSEHTTLKLTQEKESQETASLLVSFHTHSCKLARRQCFDWPRILCNLNSMNNDPQLNFWADILTRILAFSPSGLEMWYRTPSKSGKQNNWLWQEWKRKEVFKCWCFFSGGEGGQTATCEILFLNKGKSRQNTSRMQAV